MKYGQIFVVFYNPATTTTEMVGPFKDHAAVVRIAKGAWWGIYEWKIVRFVGDGI